MTDKERKRREEEERKRKQDSSIVDSGADYGYIAGIISSSSPDSGCCDTSCGCDGGGD